VGIGGAPDAINVNELLHVERTINGNASSLDIVSNNPGTGGARLYPQTGANATARAFYILNFGTGVSGNWWTAGPTVANSIGFQEDRNASYVTSPAQFVLQTQSTNNYFRSTDASSLWRFFQNTTEIFTIGASAITSGLPLAMGSNKITGQANGTAASDSAAFGQIKFIQAVQSTSTTQFTTTNNTFTSTNLTGTITPTSASNRIRITISNTLAVGTTAKTIFSTIARATTNLGGSAGMTEFSSAAANQFVPVSISYIDSPATTSATTYNLQIRNTDGVTSVYAGDNNLTQIMILEEIV
jgi:hypothetical protein